MSCTPVVSQLRTEEEEEGEEEKERKDSRTDGMDEDEDGKEAEGVRLRQCVQADSISDQENQIITRFSLFSLSMSLDEYKVS